MKLFTPDELHGKVITYDQIKRLPSRNAYLDKDVHENINKQITKGTPLLFMPNDLHEMHLQDKKYAKAKYKIVLFGILLDGRRATVVINGIQPYFDVLITLPKVASDAEDSEEQDTESGLAQDLFDKLKSREFAKPEKFDIMKAKRFKIYQKERGTYARFYFNKLKTRREALKYVRERGYETATDDKSCYYRVVCRDNLTTFSTWLDVSDYTIRSYDSIRGSVYDVDIRNVNPCTKDITKHPELAKDNLMTCCWDIETYSPDGQFPIPDNLDHKMFMIGVTFQWHHAASSMLRVCLVDHPAAARPNYLTIVCGSEKKLIKAFGKLAYKMKPEIYLGFNDSDYDWPWLVKRAYHYKGVLTFLAECFDHTVPWKNYDDESIMKYNYKKEKIKLEADAYADGYTLKFPGYLTVDVRTIYRQLFPTAEKSSLNFYLALSKLGGKKDMPYQELFAIYRKLDNLLQKDNPDTKQLATLKQQMAEVADYCVIDSQRCHELMKIRSVLMDRRATANLTYCSVFDAFFRANGMKVRNLVIARGQRVGLKFSNITNGGDVEEGKYPGAYVFPPKKGLVTSKMTIAERIGLANAVEKYSGWIEVTDDQVAEFYEVVMEYGACVSQSMIDDIVMKREDDGMPPFPKCFLDFLVENIGRPITGLDFSSLYPSIMMTYNLSPEYIIIDKREAREAVADGHVLHKIKFDYNGRIVRGWAIRHDNKIDPNDPDCKFGIYPMILKELFDSRKVMKVPKNHWEEEKERMDALPPEEFNKPETQKEYEDVCFKFGYYDSKQKALKLMMNTFYGESGNKRSPFFVLQLAGAITTAGQENIKMVQKHVEKKGCVVFYGDTDSLYLAMAKENFNDIDKLYYTGKIDKETYWSELVNITFKVITLINDDVNTMLKKDNGTKFLKMAYEEALFPAAFLAKKKYYGIPHISVPNFQPKKLFIRGLEVKKRGVSDVLKKVCMSIMWDSVSLTNLYTLMELVHAKIDNIYSTKWDFNDFVMTDVFKPLKRNVKVHTFAGRMAQEGITVKPYERFRYVIVKKNPFKYDERGRKTKLSIGERMEYADRAEEKKMTIDLDYYMQGSINGQLSRLVTYDSKFHVVPTGNTADELKTADDKTYANACKYIENYCKKYYSQYHSKGKVYQNIFRMSNKAITTKMKEHYADEVVGLLNGSYDRENITKWLDTKAEKAALKSIKGYGKEHVDAIMEKLTDKIETKLTEEFEAKFDDEEPTNKEKKKLREEIASACKFAKKEKMKELQDMYFARKSDSMLQKREKAFKERCIALNRQLNDNLDAISMVLNHHVSMITNVSKYIKTSLNIDKLYNDAGDEVPVFGGLKNADSIDVSVIKETANDQIKAMLQNEQLTESVNKMKIIYINITSNYEFINKTRAIVDYLKLCRNKSIGLVGERPDTFDVNAHIKNSVDAIVNEIANDRMI
jgi:DNA polymerase elongation subunit (family B)